MPGEFWLFLTALLGAIAFFLTRRSSSVRPSGVDLVKVDKAKQVQASEQAKSEAERKEELERIGQKQDDAIARLLDRQREQSGIVLKQAEDKAQEPMTLDNQTDWLLEQGRQAKEEKP